MDRRNFLGAAALPLLASTSSACAQVPEGSQVFVGRPNADPEKQPIAVFRNQSLTDRISQPLLIGKRDEEGHAFAAASSYSLRVRNAAGSQVLYVAAASGPVVLGPLRLRPSPLSSSPGMVATGGARSVLEFGAKGDGVTDDTSAIQAALNSLDHNGALYFPPTGGAAYKVSRSLLLPSRVGLSLFGSPGRKAARIQLVGASAATDIIRRADPSTAEANNINDTSIVGLSFVAAGPSRHAINMTCMSRSLIRDCVFEGLGGAAIYVFSSLSSVVTGCRANVCGEFLLQDDTKWTGLNGWLIAGNYASLMRRWGIDIRVGMTGSAIHGNTIESCQAGGIRLRQDCHGIDVRGNYLEHNRAEAANSTDLYIGETSFCRAIVVEGNYFNGSTEASDFYYPLRMGYADGCRIANNVLATGSKWMKFETPNNVDNELGSVSFHTGAFKASGADQPTLNFAGHGLAPFIAAGNRIDMPGLRNR